MQRRLAAIMATDVVGYSRLVRVDEARTLATLKAHREQIIQPKILQHRGRIVKLIGDGLLAEFPSAVEAVQCAVEIQQLLIDHVANDPAETKVVYRAAINIGDIVVDDDDIYGDGVNVASRIEGLAEPGGVYIARNVFNQVKDKLELNMEMVGAYEVKNIDEPVTVYQVLLDAKAAGMVTPVVTKAARFSRRLWPVAAVLIVALAGVVSGIVAWQPWQADKLAAPTETEAVPRRAKPGIAVLPFDTFNNDEQQRFLAEGFSEDITTGLARGTSLHVIARTSSFSLKEQGLDAQKIAEALDVRYVLEGSLRRTGETLRIVAQLIDAWEGNHLWAEHFDIGASEIYETQDDIIERIVTTLTSEIRETGKAEVLRQPPDSLDVYELTVQGVALKHRLNAKDMLTARKVLSHAVELDPDYAPAWLYQGWVEAIAIVFQYSQDPDFPTLEDAISKVEKAIELDPTLASAYQGLGLLKSWDGDVEGALRAARRSVELGPYDADNLLFLGRALANNGKFDEAETYARQAIELNPIRPSYYDYNLGIVLWGLGKFEESQKSMSDCLVKAPGFTGCRVFEIADLSAMSALAEAEKAVAELLERSPNYLANDAIQIAPGNEEKKGQLVQQLIEAGMPHGST